MCAHIRQKVSCVLGKLKTMICESRVGRIVLLLEELKKTSVKREYFGGVSSQ
jgi:hypothetical protein